MNCPAIGADGPKPSKRSERVLGGLLDGSEAEEEQQHDLADAQSPPSESREIEGSMDSWAVVSRTRFRGQICELPDDKTIYAACLPQTASLADVSRAFAGVPDRVLVVGDLVNVAISDWPELEASLDLPFVRAEGCEDAFVVRPAEVIFQAASAAQEEIFGGEPFVSVHWRRGDFKSYCFWHGPKNACFFPPKQVSSWAACTEIFKAVAS